MDYSIMIEGQMGLTWTRWKRLVQEVERLGFSGLYRSDHFTNAGPPDQDSLEAWVALTYLADRSERLEFGPLVSPVSFRHPAVLARQAAALDDLSDGRMILGMGAGWQQREHELFGYELGDVDTRMARLEEGLEVVTRLFQSDGPVSFDGRFYRLDGATLLPRPARPGGPRILVGGNGVRRTLPLAARYAQVWNATSLTPEAFQQRCRRLDELLAEQGRKPSDLKRTLMTGTFFGKSEDALQQRFKPFQDNPAISGKPPHEVATILRDHGALAGGPDEIVRQLADLEEAGVEEIMMQWLDLDDLEGIASLAEALVGGGGGI